MLSSAQQNSDEQHSSFKIPFSRCLCFITVFQEISGKAYPQGIIDSLHFAHALPSTQ